MYWRGILDLPDLSFAPATIKCHKPLTNRKDVGDTCHGCLSIYVRQGAHLLQQVEGGSLARYPAPAGSCQSPPETRVEGAPFTRLTSIRLWGNGILLAFGAMRSWFESRQPSMLTW